MSKPTSTTCIFSAVLRSRSGESMATIAPLLMMHTLWHSLFASSMLCVVRMTVEPFWFISLTLSIIRRRLMTSRPSVGSSRMRMGGSFTRAQAMLTRCLIPLENLRARSSPLSFRPRSAKSFSALSCLRDLGRP